MPASNAFIHAFNPACLHGCVNALMLKTQYFSIGYNSHPDSVEVKNAIKVSDPKGEFIICVKKCPVICPVLVDTSVGILVGVSVGVSVGT